MGQRDIPCEKCGKPSWARKLCSTHYSAWRESGEFVPVRKMTDVERFWSKVDRSGGPDACWWWTGTISPNGYGDFFINGGSPRIWKAHRYSYMLHSGDLPEGLHIDHMCHTKECPTPGNGDKCRSCVNPSHLQAVTHQVNVVRGQSAERTREYWANAVTHCPSGHEYTPENIRWEYRENGKGRHCRACNRRRRHEFLERRRQMKSSGEAAA